MTITGMRTPNKMARLGDDGDEDVIVGVSLFYSGITVFDSTEIIE